MRQHPKAARRSALCVGVCMMLGLVLTDVAAGAPRFPTYQSPAYHGAHPIPPTGPPVLPSPTALSASGRFPNVFVDGALTEVLEARLLVLAARSADCVFENGAAVREAQVWRVPEPRCDDASDRSREIGAQAQKIAVAIHEANGVFAE